MAAVKRMAAVAMMAGLLTGPVGVPGPARRPGRARRGFYPWHVFKDWLGYRRGSARTNERRWNKTR
jgi:hypothetical protein